MFLVANGEAFTGGNQHLAKSIHEELWGKARMQRIEFSWIQSNWFTWNITVYKKLLLSIYEHWHCRM